jgi:hypothetical protein
MDYDVHLFIEIIESVKGIIWLTDASEDGYSCKFYEGLNGKRVQIDTSDDYITDEMGRSYLHQLGLSHLVPSIFPADTNLNEHLIDHYCKLDTSKLLQVKFHDSDEVMLGRIVAMLVNHTPYPLKNEKTIGRFKLVKDISDYLKNPSLNNIEAFAYIDLTKDVIVEIIDVGQK